MFQISKARTVSKYYDRIPNLTAWFKKALEEIKIESKRKSIDLKTLQLQLENHESLKLEMKEKILQWQIIMETEPEKNPTLQMDFEIENLIKASDTYEDSVSNNMRLVKEYQSVMRNLMTSFEKLETYPNDPCFGDMKTVQKLMIKNIQIESDLKEKQNKLNKLTRQLYSVATLDESKEVLLQTSQVNNRLDDLSISLKARARQLEEAQQMAMELENRFIKLNEWKSQARMIRNDGHLKWEMDQLVEKYDEIWASFQKMETFRNKTVQLLLNINEFCHEDAAGEISFMMKEQEPAM